MDNNGVSFFIGAGAEIDYGMPSGAEFKVDTIICKGVKEFILKINKNNSDYFSKLNDGYYVTKNNTRILYDAVLVNSNNPKITDDVKNKFPIIKKDDWNIIEQYIDYKLNKPDTKSSYNSFKTVFEKTIFESVNELSELSNDQIIDYDKKKTTIENLRFYSSIDSKFNYLSNPNLYINECNKVIKLYYSAYLSILKKIVGQNFNKLIDSDNIRKDLFNYINIYSTKCKDTIVDSYYSIIKKYSSKVNKVITTNYTSICDDILGKDKCIHIHGSMLEFENLITKEIKNIDEFNDNDIVFPYILIQSGIKPIIHPKQIESLYKAYDSLRQSKCVIVLGYKFSYDDEHIISLFKELLNNNIIVKYLYFTVNHNLTIEDATKEVQDILQYNNDNLEVSLLYNNDDLNRVLNSY